MHSFILTTLLSLFFAQAAPTVVWKAAVNHIQDNSYQLVVTGQVADGYYVHPMSDPYVGTVLEINGSESVRASGEPSEEFTPSDYKGENVVTGAYILRQGLTLAGGGQATVSGTVTWSACSGDTCNMPEDYEFSVPVQLSASNVSEAASQPASKGLWALILEAILWGFLMLLTPCVFPMVPMTVSFFLKRSETPAKGRFNAAMYGLFIVLLYTVPISIIIGLTWALGGKTVTADIFNWLSTHWLPNILFFIIFMVFAASFFGAFEITLPSKWTNKADSGSDRKGLAGVFFLALTLVLVSFSCTGPIVGTVLIKSTQGEFWTPMVTMLAFSIAFALPFALLAFFPSVLKKLPKSGGWLNSVKVVLGFIEIALGLKFLSVADQTYHWHLLDREVYLAIWIVCFTLLGLYLLGKIRFAHDSPLQHLSVFRLILVIIDFSFVVYMLPGMWGAPLKALSGYLPPITTQDFVLDPAQHGGEMSYRVGQSPDDGNGLPATRKYADFLHMPYGIPAFFDYEEARAYAVKVGKPLLVDFTGHGCVNCREMESRVWSDPRVLKLMKNDYVVCSLYGDDKKVLDKADWVTTEDGKVLKSLGKINSYFVMKRYQVNAQPYYAIIDPVTERHKVPSRSYNLDVDQYVAFLEKGLE